MSEATDALADGLTDSLSQHGVAVSVDGGSTVTAVVQSFHRGNTPTESGVREMAGSLITFARSAWTPAIGKRLTVGGMALVVASVDYTNPASFVVTAVGGNL
jgi:hypothetical protein